MQETRNKYFRSNESNTTHRQAEIGKHECQERTAMTKLNNGKKYIHKIVIHKIIILKIVNI